MQKIFFILFFYSLNSLAGVHALKSHEHGAVVLGIAVENNTVDLSLTGPAESFLPFEYIPKTPKDIANFKKVQDLWEKNIFKLITFDKKLNCKIIHASLKQVVDEKETKESNSVHSDIEADAQISCNLPVSGSKAIVSIKKNFKSIKNLKAEIIGLKTLSLDIVKENQEINL